MGFYWPTQCLLSQILGLHQGKQALPSLMEDHTHLGYESWPSNQVVSRMAWRHAGSRSVIIKDPLHWVKEQRLGGTLGCASVAQVIIVPNA